MNLLLCILVCLQLFSFCDESFWIFLDGFCRTISTILCWASSLTICLKVCESIMFFELISVCFFCTRRSTWISFMCPVWPSLLTVCRHFLVVGGDIPEELDDVESISDKSFSTKSKKKKIWVIIKSSFDIFYWCTI
jgi:hypothetical protein